MVGTVEQAVYAMGLNAGDYVRESQRVAQSNEALLQSTEQVAVAEEKLQRATRLTSEGFGKLEAQYDPLIRAEQKRQRQLEATNRYLEVGRISEDRAAAHMARVNQQIDAQTEAYRRLNVANDASANSLNAAGQHYRRFGTIAQQAGYQVGDFAVQVASGQGVLRPFIQQGTQLVSMFGPWGAVIGAAGAVVGALGVAFLETAGAADKSAEATKKQDDALKRMIETMAEAKEAMASSVVASALRDARSISAIQERLGEGIGQLTEQYAGAQVALEKLQRQQANEDQAGQGFNKYGAEIDAATKKLQDLEKQINSMNDAFTELSDPENLGSSKTRALEAVLQQEKERADARERGAKLAAEIEKKATADASKERKELDREDERRREAALKSEIQLQDEIQRGLEQADTAVARWREAQEKRETALRGNIEGLQLEADLVGRSTAERETLLRIRQEELAVQRALSEDEKQQIANAIALKNEKLEAIKAQDQARRDAEKYQADINRAAERVLDQIADSAGDILFDYMEGRSGSFWETFARLGKRAFAQLLAEQATQTLFRPFVASAVSSLPQMFGVSLPGAAIQAGGSAPAGGGTGFGGFTLPSFGNLSFAGMDAWGAGTGIFSGLSTPGMTAANQAALTEAAMLGGSGAPISSSGMLPFTASQAFAGLGTALSAYSFAKNPNVGSGLSLAGSGAALLSSLGMIAPAFGPIGMGVAAVGAILGSVLSKRSKPRGSWGTGAYQTSVEDELRAGGAFGTSNVPAGQIKTTWFGEDGTPTAAGYYSSGLYGDTASQAMLIQQQLGRSSRALASRYGVSLAGQNLGNYMDQTRGSILTALTAGGSDAYGKVWQRNLSAFNYEYDDPASFDNAMARAQLLLLARSSGGDANVRTAAQMLSKETAANENALSAGDISSLLGFAENFKLILQSVSGGAVDYSQAAGIQARAAAQQTFQSIQDLIDTAARLGQDTEAATAAGKSAIEIMLGLKDAAPQMSAAQQAMAQLSATFENAGEYLAFIGRDASEAAGLLQQAQQKLAAAANDNYDALILGLSNPYAAAQQALDKERAQALADADTLGADRNKVIQYYNQRALELEKQYLGDRNAALQEANDSIAAYLAGNAINDPSLTAAQRLSAAQQQFDTALTSARGGDSEARSSLGGLADAVLRAGADQYDTATPEYSALRTMIRSTLGQLAGLQGYADGVASAPGGWAMVGEEGPELAYIPRGTAVLPTDVSTRLLNGSGGSGGDLGGLVENLIAVTRLQAAEIVAMNKKLDRLAMAFERQTDAAIQARMRRITG
ncbi:hypothetical protein [Ferrovibrio sp.]|uniref:hypothetical protein n=1 Tax=Ferrovibrio sp. TaxID=1917215 RepID=UPI0035AEA9E6